MPTYTDEELEQFIISGDAQENESGSVTWAVDNQYGKKPGTFLRRPPGAAPLIDEDSAKELALVRQDRRLQAAQEGVSIGISKALESGIPLTKDEATLALGAILGEAAVDLSRKDFARVMDMALEIMEAKKQKKIEIDQRRQTIDMSQASVQILADSPAIKRLLEGNGEAD